MITLWDERKLPEPPVSPSECSMWDDERQRLEFEYWEVAFKIDDLKNRLDEIISDIRDWEEDNA